MTNETFVRVMVSVEVRVRVGVRNLELVIALDIILDGHARLPVFITSDYVYFI